MRKNKVIRIRFTEQMLTSLQDRVVNLKTQFPHKHISLGMIVRFLTYCFLNETFCIAKTRLETILSHDIENGNLLEIL